MLRRLLGALAAAAAVVAMVPSAASAATYLVRPTGTVALGSGWVVTPSTSTADAVLAKNVTQPATPATSSFITAGTSSSGHATTVWVSKPPALRTGETLKQVTAWAYLNTATFQPMTLSLSTWSYFGWYQLASATVPAGSPAGWYSATTQGNVDPEVLNAMAVGFTPSGTGGGSNVYAGYAEVDTNDPPPAPSSATSQSSTPAPAPTPAPTVTTDTKQLVSDVSLAAQTVSVALSSKAIPITLSCAASVAGGCQGTLTLRLASPAPAAGKSDAPRAVTSRCARGCRPLGKAHFQILAGRSQRVKVHLAHSARRVFGKHQRVTLQATTVTKDESGHTEVSNTAVTLTRPGASSGG